MKIVFLILLLTIPKILNAQTIIKVEVTGDPATASIKFDKEIEETLIPGQPYKIEVSGVNSAHTTLKIQSISKEIYTPIPEVLKTLLPGISGSFTINKGGDYVDSDLIALIADVQTKITNLNTLKVKAVDLHKNTLLVPNPGLAITEFNSILGKYPGSTDEDIETYILSDINYILSFKDILDSRIKLTPALDNDEVKLNSLVTNASNELKKYNFAGYINYINRSRTAVSFIKSKTFVGNKDLVELKIILIDNFSKDTLSNELVTLYTKGGKNIGLSFSTGFFYTENLSDKPYYLHPRPDERMAVLSDKKMGTDLSIGGLAHLYYKFTPFTRIGPSIGLSISPFDGKSRYLLGLTGLLGKEKMVGVTFGWAWAKKKILSDAVNTDELGQFLPKGATTVPTIDHVDNNFFIGLTYNLVSTRK